MLGAFRPEERIWVVAVGKRDNAHGDFGGEKHACGTNGRLVARSVVVIYEDGLARDALEHPDMLVGERRSLTCNGVCETARMEAYAVDLPFADYHFAVRVLANRAACAVEPEENVRLLEDRRLR